MKTNQDNFEEQNDKGEALHGGEKPDVNSREEHVAEESDKRKLNKDDIKSGPHQH